MRYKIVTITKRITVPTGKYCWAEDGICNHFDSELANECSLNIGEPIKINDNEYLKPDECQKLS